MSELDQTINQLFDNPADRMIAKLYLDNYDTDEIARFAGLAVDAITGVIHRLSACMLSHAG
jgi:hypothetical protein